MTDRPPENPGAEGQPLQPGHVVDRYEVEGVIGSGGTATVYRVRHRDLNTIYALKVLGLVSPSIRRRTYKEGKVQARIQHRNVVGVFDVFEVRGSPGLLMEYVEGPSLESALARHRFSYEHAGLLFRGILSGVQLAHSHGLVHRDLKPANVLLADTGDGLVPKVTDFGIAKVVEEGEIGHTRAGVAMGTPQYMSPEQIRDARSVDTRADVFSLGCILYELFTGQRAFPHDDILKVYNAICDGEYIPASEVDPEISARVDMAVAGALAVDRERRIPNCETLLAVFEGRRRWSVDDPTEVEVSLDPADEASYPADEHLPTALLVDLTDASGQHSGPLPDETSLPEPSWEEVTQDDEMRPVILVSIAALLGLTAIMLLITSWVWSRSAANRAAPTPPAQTVATMTATPIQVAIPKPTATPVAPIPTPPVATPQVAKTPTPAPATPRATPRKTPKPTPTATPRPTPTATPATPAPATPTPPPAATASTVRLFALPRTAELWIDGRGRGRTPFKSDLDHGTHRVMVQNGDIARTFTIDVKPGADNKWCYVFDSSKAVKGSCPR